MNNELHHYITIGSLDVRLADGFRWIDTDHGRSLAISDVEGLNKAIGMYIIRTSKVLSREEFRFLRESMLMSQKHLGDLLDVTKGTVLRWENDKGAIPYTADIALRQMFAEYAIGTNSFRDMLREIEDLENDTDERSRTFSTHNDGWQPERIAA